MRFFKKVIIRIYQKRWGRLLFSPFQKDRSGKKYVFILGCYNSGTTLLNHIIGTHPEVSSLPTEGLVLTSGLTRPEDFGWPRMWHMCADKVRLNENSRIADPLKVRKDWSFWYDKEKQIYLEKSIANSAKIKWFEKNFDSPYFIWIIRNGYCVAEGIKRRSMNIDRGDFKYRKGGYPIAMCAKQWVVNNSVIEKDSESVKNLMKVSYEDLVDDLEGTTKEIFKWLPVKEKRLRLSNIREFYFHNETRPLRNMNPDSFARLSENDITEINLVAQDYLARCGYKIC